MGYWAGMPNVDRQSEAFLRTRLQAHLQTMGRAELVALIRWLQRQEEGGGS